MRNFALKLLAAAVGASVGLAAQAQAQQGATKLRSEASVYGFDFLKQPPGTVGVILDSDCDSTGLTGRRTYLVQDMQIYWGVTSNCVRVVLNHRSTVDKPDYSYLGAQVVGFFDEPPPSSILLRRSGTFLRDQEVLKNWDDKEFAPEQLDHEKWDSLNGTGAIVDLDQKLTAKWYGVPQGGHSDAWDERNKFRSKNFDALLTLTHKTLDNRLIRFSPYPAAGRPSDGPVGFYLGKRGARAVAVRVFSPVSGDYNHTFVLVFESNPTVVAQLVKRQVVQSGFFGFFQ